MNTKFIKTIKKSRYTKYKNICIALTLIDNIVYLM